MGPRRAKVFFVAISCEHPSGFTRQAIYTGMVIADTPAHIEEEFREHYKRYNFKDLRIVSTPMSKVRLWDKKAKAYNVRRMFLKEVAPRRKGKLKRRRML